MRNYEVKINCMLMLFCLSLLASLAKAQNEGPTGSILLLKGASIVRTASAKTQALITADSMPIRVLPRLSLDSLLAKVAENPALQAFEAQAKAQDAYARGAKSLDAPKLSIGQYQVPYQWKPQGGSFMIQAEQMFGNPAKRKAKEAYMKAQSFVTIADKAYMKNQLLSQAKQYYYERAVLEKKEALLRQMRTLLNYLLKDANIRLSYGKEALSAIYKIKADLFKLDDTREQLDNEIQQKNVLLNTLMNQDKKRSFSIDTNIIVKNYEISVIDTASLSHSRSDIQRISHSISLQNLNAQVEHNKRKPDFGLQVAHMISYGGFPDQYVLMASATIPIAPWAAREYKANLKGIRYEVEELEQKKLDVLNQTVGKLEGLKLDISSKKKQLQNYNKNIIPALKNSFETSLLAYDQNTGDLASVLTGIKDLLDARLDALDRLQELLVLQVTYEREDEQ